MHQYPKAVLPDRPSKQELRQKYQVLWFLITLVEITQSVPPKLPCAPCSSSARISLSVLPICLLSVFLSHHFVHFTTNRSCCISLHFFTLHSNQSLGFCNACHISILTTHRTLPFLPLGICITLCLHLTPLPFSISLHLLHYTYVNTYISTTAGSAGSLFLPCPPATSTSQPH